MKSIILLLFLALFLPMLATFAAAQTVTVTWTCGPAGSTAQHVYTSNCGPVASEGVPTAPAGTQLTDLYNDAPGNPIQFNPPQGNAAVDSHYEFNLGLPVDPFTYKQDYYNSFWNPGANGAAGTITGYSQSCGAKQSDNGTPCTSTYSFTFADASGGIAWSGSHTVVYKWYSQCRRCAATYIVSGGTGSMSYIGQ